MPSLTRLQRLDLPVDETDKRLWIITHGAVFLLHLPNRAHRILRYQPSLRIHTHTRPHSPTVSERTWFTPLWVNHPVTREHKCTLLYPTALTPLMIVHALLVHALIVHALTCPTFEHAPRHRSPQPRCKRRPLDRSHPPGTPDGSPAHGPVPSSPSPPAWRAPAEFGRRAGLNSAGLHSADHNPAAHIPQGSTPQGYSPQGYIPQRTINQRTVHQIVWREYALSGVKARASDRTRCLGSPG